VSPFLQAKQYVKTTRAKRKNETVVSQAVEISPDSLAGDLSNVYDSFDGELEFGIEGEIKSIPYPACIYVPRGTLHGPYIVSKDGTVDYGGNCHGRAILQVD